jgi:phosphate starvation-inducible PhoH-like protein
MAVAALKPGGGPIILTARREAGERLGFLPGDLAEKVHPHLAPAYDAL